jgi:predicted ester cyclase
MMALTEEKSQEVLRKNLKAFHESLAEAKYDNIEKLIAPDYYWNYDGAVILSSKQGRQALEGFVESTLHGLECHDIYNILDGNRGAVLFRISGRQTGPFLGLPVQQDGLYNIKSAESFLFDEDAKARTVHTVTPTSVMKQQMKGSVNASSFSQETSIKSNPQTSLEFRKLLRKNLRSLYLSANTGDSQQIHELAIDAVEVDENGTKTMGRDQFYKLITSQNAGLGAFPKKLFHAVEFFADGHFGAVEYVWQGMQESEYQGVPVREGAAVRMRGMVFFEFNSDGLITKATGVWNEDVVLATLTGQGGYLYP